jgi:fructose-1-phosphate kinase PfkB-like protein
MFREKSAILTVCLNPVIQKTLLFDGLQLDEVNRAREHRVDASGKGINVSRVLRETGRRAIHLTQAGGPTRDWFLALSAADGLELRWAESGSEIRFCYTVIDRRGGTATELVEEGRPVGEGTAQAILGLFAKALPECGALVISGTRAAGFPDGLYPEMVRRAKEAGLLVVLDLKGKDLLSCLPQRPDVVKPNLTELLGTVPGNWTGAAAGRGAVPGLAADGGAMSEGRAIPGLAAGGGAGGSSGHAAVGGSAGAPDAGEAALREHVAGIAREWHGRHGTSLVVTRGSRPTWYWSEGGLRESPVEARPALNPTGSGDAFTAGLAAYLLEGRGLAAAVAEGNRLGGLNAVGLKPGSVAGEGGRHA